MERRVLTDLAVRSIVAKERERVEIWDAKLPGFGVRVSPKGTKTFVLLYYFKGRKRRHTLGRFPMKSLAEARADAMEIVGRAKKGLDPQRGQTRTAQEFEFGAVMTEFLVKHCAVHNRVSTANGTTRILRSRFEPAWSGRDIRDIRRTDIVAVLDAAIKANTPSAANHALAAVRKLFSWCVERGMVETNPCLGISRPAPKVPRERVLSDTELAAIWGAAHSTGHPFGTIVKLLILTAQRRGEVAGMRWTEFDLDKGVWTIPGTRTKNTRTHTLPLSNEAVALIASIPKINNQLVFPARGNDAVAMSGFSKLKPKLAIGIEVQNWTLHDLRRTAATGMARQGVAPHVVERILNHASGTFAGIAGIYNRFEYQSEMRLALDRWAEHVAHVGRARPSAPVDD